MNNNIITRLRENGFDKLHSKYYSPIFKNMLHNECCNIKIFKPKCASHKHGLSVTSPSTACRNLACPNQSYATVPVCTKQLQSRLLAKDGNVIPVTHLIQFPRDGFKGKVLSNNSSWMPYLQGCFTWNICLQNATAILSYTTLSQLMLVKI